MKINIKKQSGIYTLTSKQILPISLEKAWEFFTHPNNLDRIYTAASFGLFTLLMIFQIFYQWEFARKFYISFVLIYVPFFFVNSALTGSYSENPVVFYDNNENLGIRVGTMPLEDSFYCFSMLYGSVLLFEYFRRKWNYSLSMSVKS